LIQANVSESVTKCESMIVCLIVTLSFPVLNVFSFVEKEKKKTFIVFHIGYCT